MRLAPPRFGEHARAILREHGYADDEIDALERSGVVPPRRGG
jgi:crotonobetainyl-CoA:carnitine CoA-transferase CaiB-like acyl-CoA transferase